MARNRQDSMEQNISQMVQKTENLPPGDPQKLLPFDKLSNESLFLLFKYFQILNKYSWT